MLNSTRRNFLRNSTLAVGGLMLSSAKTEKHNLKKSPAIGCAPGKTNAALFGTIASVRSGEWSDPSTWGGKVPQPGDTPLIKTGHTVVFDVSKATVEGVNVDAGGVLQFDASKSVSLESTKNIIIQGKLQMKPSSSSHVHLLRFINIKERDFKGGGMDPIDSDVGLWVMGSGQLDLIGSAKRAWTRAGGSVSSGNKSFTTSDSPAGWAVGDEIFIVPTDAPPYGTMPEYDNATGLGKGSFLSKFERRTITDINGKNITLSSSFSYDHPEVKTNGGKKYTAEVGNLTRNVRIEGTVSGKTHVFIHSSGVHTIKNVALRYVGPRKDANGDGREDMVAGRYGLHFHHCMFSSEGSIVENCVIYDAGNHAYVPHVSHGITMKNNVSFNTMQTAFWWDFQDLTHDTVWDGNLIAACYSLPRTLDTTDPSGESSAGGAGVGMLLGMGDGNIANNNVVVYGGVGDEHAVGGYSWEADNEGVWEFENNLAHSNHCGIRVWQNTSKNHTIINYDSYNNYLGIFHGSYTNSYTYRGGYHYNSLVEIKATSSNSSGVRFEHVTFDGGGKMQSVVHILPSPIASGDDHNVLLKCTFRNYTSAGVLMDTFPIDGEDVRKHVDLIMCNFSGNEVAFTSDANSDSFFRIQPASGQVIRIRRSGGKSNLNPFTSYLWGTGTGLMANYYNGTGLDSLAFSRVDSVIMFTQWRPDKVFSPTGVHYAIKNEKYSVRWTGKIQAQSSEDYVFKMSGATGYRMWLDGKLILNAWFDKGAEDEYEDSSVVQLKEGQYYDIQVECFNSAYPTNCCLYWKSESMANFSLVPQAQLYPGKVDIPDDGQMPVANAGKDITITLPVNKATLDGSASGDPDGRITSYQWTKISGPPNYKIENAKSAITGLTELVQGIYVFQLKVTDNEDNSSIDNVVVTVNSDDGGSESPEEPKPALSVSASPNPTSSNTRITVKSTVDGRISLRIYDRSGNLVYRRDNLSNNSTVSVGDGAPSGAYVVEAIQGVLRSSITVIKQ